MGKVFAAVATLIGTIIGAGILGMPYVISRAGLGLGLINLVVALAIIITVQLYLGEIALRTKKNLHLAGYAEKYLGKKGKIVMFLALAFGIYSAIVAYLIGEGESLSILFFNSSQYSVYFGIAFWIVLSGMSYFGLKALREGEKIGFIIIVGLIVAITVMFWNKIDTANLVYNNFEFIFFPFGLVIFALLGFTAIPEIERILKGRKKDMKKTIWYAYITIFLIYVIFTLIVLGSQGLDTPQIATLSLGKIFIVLGILTMATSYLALTIAFVDILRFDFKKSKVKSWFYAISMPLIFYIILNIFEATSFTKVLTISGLVSGGLTGILILFMVKKSKKLGDRKPEYQIPYSGIITWIIILIFATATIMEIIKSF